MTRMLIDPLFSVGIGLWVSGTAGPSTALPRISCWTWWRCRNSCALLYGRAHTRTCLVQRGRKSGYASVGMTLLLGTSIALENALIENRAEIAAVATLRYPGDQLFQA